MPKDTFLEKLFEAREEVKSAGYGGELQLTPDQQNVLAAAQERIVKQAEAMEADGKHVDFDSMSEEQYDEILAQAVREELADLENSEEDMELESSLQKIAMAKKFGEFLAHDMIEQQSTESPFMQKAASLLIAAGTMEDDSIVKQASDEGMTREDLIKLANDESALGEYAGQVAASALESLNSGEGNMEKISSVDVFNAIYFRAADLLVKSAAEEGVDLDEVANEMDDETAAEYLDAYAEAMTDEGLNDDLLELVDDDEDDYEMLAEAEGEFFAKTASLLDKVAAKREVLSAGTEEAEAGRKTIRNLKNPPAKTEKQLKAEARAKAKDIRTAEKANKSAAKMRAYRRAMTGSSQGGAFGEVSKSSKIGRLAEKGVLKGLGGRWELFQKMHPGTALGMKIGVPVAAAGGLGYGIYRATKND
jgi:hypothetical protein